CETELAGGTAAEALLDRRERLLVERDRLLDEYLRDRSRRPDTALPALAEVSDLERRFPPGCVYVAPSVVEDELFLLVARRGRPAAVVPAPGSAARLARQADAFRACLSGQLERYRHGFPLGAAERAALDARLEELGASCLGAALPELL